MCFSVVQRPAVDGGQLQWNFDPVCICVVHWLIICVALVCLNAWVMLCLWAQETPGLGCDVYDDWDYAQCARSASTVSASLQRNMRTTARRAARCGANMPVDAQRYQRDARNDDRLEQGDFSFHVQVAIVP
eukprot:SAG11_NODE_2237_length_3650_cov_49.920867_3_plen_131_part_00